MHKYKMKYADSSMVMTFENLPAVCYISVNLNGTRNCTYGNVCIL